MNVKKQSIFLILLAALLVGFIGAYTAVKITEPDTNTEQKQDKAEKSQDKTEESAELSTEDPEDMTKVTQAYHLIQEHYVEDVDEKELLEGAIQGMLETLDDPYSTYMDVESMENFNEQIESSFEGIGAEVSMVDGQVTIIAPIKDSPAEHASLKPNDQILSIDEEDLKGLDLNEAVEKIRGEKGSKVTLEIKRPGVSDAFNVVVTRDKIPLETVYSDLKTIDGKETGILELTSFSETTADDFTEELEKLEAKNIEGLVIDVRGNPGGLLDSVEEIMEHFITKDEPYIQIEDKAGDKQPYYSSLAEEKEYPINVLIDEGSASASEILAVAMKETDHEIIGETSFGKGTVQQAVPLGDGSTIKLTFFKWLSPKGTWIHEDGIEPTIEKKQPDYYYTNPVQLDKTLAFDDTGEDIENIQKMLIGLGYETDRKDGFFDKDTEKAVQSFQQDHDLKATGTINEKTAGSIEAEIIDKIRNGEDDQQLEEALNVLYK